MEIKRHVAYKVWLKEIINQKVKRDEGEFSPYYVLFQDKKISKLNIIATVVEKYVNNEKTYGSVTLDDGSGMIRIKLWHSDVKVVEQVELSDVVIVVGRVRQGGGENYIIPDFMKKYDPLWLKIRQAELIKLYGSPEPKQVQIVYETIAEEGSVTGSVRQEILNLIDKMDKGNGVDMIELVENIPDGDVEEAIQELLAEGEIFNPKPGKVKLIG